MAKKIPEVKRKDRIIKGISSSETAQIAEQKISEDFLISFKYLDRNQGQTLEEWQKEKILARAIEALRHYYCNTLASHLGNGLTIYNMFPVNSGFIRPYHVPEDAKWARIHITGKQVIAGYVNRNIFNIVFLDKEHDFYITKKRNT